MAERNLAVQEAKAVAQIKALKREERLKAWNDYIGFIFTKLSGLVCLSGGVLEIMEPSLIPTTLHNLNPSMLIGAGLALLVGSKAVNVLSKVLDALK
jgi:hypothetical protein